MGLPNNLRNKLVFRRLTMFICDGACASVTLLNAYTIFVKRNVFFSKTKIRLPYTFRELPGVNDWIMCALLNAVEEADNVLLEELLKQSLYNVDAINKRGDAAIHLAARQGNQSAVILLRDHNADLDLANALGDTAAILAAKHGDRIILRILAEAGANLSLHNKEGETCLHAACLFGDANLVQFICSQPNVNLDQQDQEGESALHIAALHGHVDCAKCLVDHGCTVDLPNSMCATPLHLALTVRQSHMAIYLLHAGADCDLQDWFGNTPLHIAAREGLLTALQTLCAFACSIDVANKQELYPLHLAALHGHMEIVRYLCLAGCNTEQKNGDGIKAEITALKHGYNNIGDLLNRLKNSVVREQYSTQLIPSNQPISKVSLKLLGHSGVGKTTLADSLQSGYFTSLFRRGKVTLPSAAAVVANVAQVAAKNSTSTQIEMDYTTRSNPLSFDTYSYQYTRGINVRPVSLSGAGEFTLWDFSGQDTYFLMHHHFLGSTQCIHAILVNLQDPPNIQLQQAFFWLSFLQSRIAPQQPFGFGGRSHNLAQVIIIATHPDLARLPRDVNGDYINPGMADFVAQLQSKFFSHCHIHDEIFTLDARAPGTSVLRALKLQLSEMKQQSLQGIPKWTGFLDATLQWLPSAQHTLDYFPVLSWEDFVTAVRTHVNPLAGHDHIRELLVQLQLMGEVVVIHCDEQDVVILSPQWLCSDILGQLLSIEFMAQARVTGCYTAEDFQAAFTECDAGRLLALLEQLQICIQCENDGEVEYEFPCYNLVDTIDGLWDPQDPRYQGNSCYGGVRLRTQQGTCHLLHSVFPRLQIQLRRTTKIWGDPDCDLYQWFHGSKLCVGLLESLITLQPTEGSGEEIEIKVRGPPPSAFPCFLFMNDLLAVIDMVVAEICPSIYLERYVMSASDLRAHSPTPFVYQPADVSRPILEGAGLNAVVCTAKGSGVEFEEIQESGLTEKPSKEDSESISSTETEKKQQETLLELIGFGATEIADIVVLGDQLPVHLLSPGCRQMLCGLLDPPDPMGKDWCLLAVQLGLADSVARLEVGSHTALLLDQWMERGDNHATIGSLMQALRSLGREDAVNVLLRLAPLYRLLSTCVETPEEFCEQMDGNRTNISR